MRFKLNLLFVFTVCASSSASLKSQTLKLIYSWSLDIESMVFSTSNVTSTVRAGRLIIFDKIKSILEFEGGRSLHSLNVAVYFLYFTENIVFCKLSYHFILSVAFITIFIGISDFFLFNFISSVYFLQRFVGMFGIFYFFPRKDSIYFTEFLLIIRNERILSTILDIFVNITQLSDFHEFLTKIDEYFPQKFSFKSTKHSDKPWFQRIDLSPNRFITPTLFIRYI